MLPALATLFLLAPASLLLATLFPSRPGPRRPRAMLLASRLATWFCLVLAVLACLLTAWEGPATSWLLGGNGIGLSVRLDAISCTMFLLGAFVAGLCRTLAAVTLLVFAGNLVQLVVAWVAMSLSLHRLLVFYPERRPARIAARKKFLAARLGDACMLGAAALLVTTFGTTDLATVLARAQAIA